MGKLNRRLPGLFDDPEVRTSEHDKIMLWLDYHVRQPGWLEAQMFWPAQHRETVIDIVNSVFSVWPSSPHNVKCILSNSVSTDVKEQIAMFRDSCILGEDIEYLKDHAGAMKQIIHKVASSSSGDVETVLSCEKPKPEWEAPILNLSWKPPVPVGYVDMAVSAGVSFSPNKHNDKAAFEVKSSWPSYGQLIRQVNGYRAYSRGGFRWFVVVAPPNKRGESLLRDQDIRFIPYEE